nr:D-xylose 1-dehydrogenase Gfo6 [Halococcus agarilyticus]
MEEFVDGFETRDWQTVTDGTVRLAVIGLGWWTIDYAIPATVDAELCETTVAVSGSKRKARRIADDSATIEHGITYDEFHDGVAADAYDAVYVCSPNALHLPFVETAAGLDKAILCEKPIEASVDRAREVVDVCVSADVPLAIDYRMHTEPAIRRARELVRAGFIGDPVHAIGTNSDSMDDLGDEPDRWRLDPDLVGSGVTVTDIGIYPLNTTRFLLDADPIAIQSVMHSEHGAFEEVPDEHTAYTTTFEDGTYLACTASSNAHTTTSLRLVGTEGEVFVEPAYHMETEIRLTRQDKTIALDTPQVNQMVEIFDYFADRVMSASPIGPSGDHGLLDMRAIEAIYEAGETGQTVHLN